MYTCDTNKSKLVIFLIRATGHFIKKKCEFTQTNFGPICDKLKAKALPWSSGLKLLLYHAPRLIPLK